MSITNIRVTKFAIDNGVFQWDAVSGPMENPDIYVQLYTNYHSTASLKYSSTNYFPNAYYNSGYYGDFTCQIREHIHNILLLYKNFDFLLMWLL